MGAITIGEALIRATKCLKKSMDESGAAAPRIDAEVLLAHVLGRDRVYLYREPGRELSMAEAGLYRDLLKRRARGEPVAYLTGSKEFMGLDFLVGPHVLIPRTETELMVEYALAVLAGWPAGNRLAVDVGTGSGAIAVSLGRLAPSTTVYATDISPAALEIAQKNAARHNVPVMFYAGDLLVPLLEVLRPGSAALVVANLPYIPREEINGLARDVRDYEPLLALDGGEDGLDHYRRLVPQSEMLLAVNGHLLMEITPGQEEPARALVPAPRWDSGILADLAGRPRLVVARLSQPAVSTGGGNLT
ncbi:peptide chain release factor N(5)-glutamine methyltransferase [Desulfotruncus alcoholivorax]|uniref:peptide chain release factor N(5)-glutamine methyltransferase n=1 Tax=Desulfotruncus alcoholivorax TaxID=265477 RepID=UPI00040665C1|nr:peptide chain release factor N(5)-glutamine methyltransferase [Desulfotruncus alcoholivorax]